MEKLIFIKLENIIQGKFEKIRIGECTVIDDNEDIDASKEICKNCKYDYTCRLSLTREKSKINNINNQILTNKNE